MRTIPRYPSVRPIRRKGFIAIVDSPPGETATRPIDEGTGNATMQAPFNLRVAPYWNSATSASITRIHFSASAGALKYALLLYSRPLTPPRETTGLYFDVPSDNQCYCVKAIGDDHAEQSVPSAWCVARSVGSPANTNPPALQPAPTNLFATAQWQGDSVGSSGESIAGTARNVLRWRGDVSWYNIYRGDDTAPVATGLTFPEYIDSDVLPGTTYTYRVTQVGYFSTIDYKATATTNESAKSAPFVVTTLSAKRPFLAQKITIKRVIAQHNIAHVYFDPVAGAQDYRAYIVGREGGYKYAGSYHQYVLPDGQPRPEDNDGYGLSIQLSGIIAPCQVVIQALDKLGAFYLQRGAAHRHDGFTFHTNGHGDPSGIPYTIAVSDPVSLSPTRVIPAPGDYFEDFENPVNTVIKTMPSFLIDSEALSINNGDIQFLQTPTLDMYQFLLDRNNSEVFVHHNHLMNISFDGDEFGGATHQANAGILFVPRKAFDISGGKAFSFSFLAPPHASDRKWFELQITGTGDVRLNPGKFAEGALRPTRNGELFRWQIKPSAHFIARFKPPESVVPSGAGVDRTVAFVKKDYSGDIYANGLHRMDTGNTPRANGTGRELDKMNRYTVTISKTRFRIEERCLFNPLFSTVFEREFGTGFELPFDSAEIALVHQVYHTGLVPPEAAGQYAANEPAQPYAARAFDMLRMPFFDEGHWAQFHGKSLPSFPPAP